MRIPPQVHACAVLASLALLAGCVSPRAKPDLIPVAPEELKSEKRYTKEYILTPGDQIEIVLRRTPEVSRTVTIRPDGYISLPLVDNVMAAGTTFREFDARLTELFSARLVEPDVTVIGMQLREPMVYVAGEVNAPQAVRLRDAPTVVQAVVAAGGFRKSAKARLIVIIRLDERGYLRAIPLGGEVKGQPGPFMAMSLAPLRGDDVIFVPESGRSQTGRFIDDFLNRPLSGFNNLIRTYLNFRLVEDLLESN